MLELETSAGALTDATPFWRLARAGAPVADVRAPGEFHQGHLPGATSVPLFDDDQRAQVGTVYKNSGRDDAILRGLRLVGPRMADLASQGRRLADDRQILVHCWRGGMRSQSIAWLFETVGLKPVVLRGGYKSFRRLARDAFDGDWPLRVVSGLTGAGKTDVLDELARQGEQVVDLERLANHRGSAFGSIGQPPQPTTEQFENDLFAALDDCDPERTIWVEDEGNRLGTVVVPPEFVHSIKRATADFLDVSPETRCQRLLTDYGDLDSDRLIESVAAIRKRLGPQHADEAIASIHRGRHHRAIEIVLDYYDRTYLHAAAKMPRQKMRPLAVDTYDVQVIAEQLIRRDREQPTIR